MLIASFLGLIFGVIISRITLEEITPASKYLKILNIILVPILIVISTFYLNKLYSIIFAAIILAALIVSRERYNDAWVYSCIGALFYASTLSGQTFIIATIIFIYGISITTIAASKHYKKKINGQATKSETISLVKKILLKYSLYPVIAILFLVIFNYIL